MRFLVKAFPESFRDHYRHTWHQVALESSILLGKIRRQVKRPSVPILDQGQVNVHLGCGSVNHPMFINIDGLSAPHIHYIQDIDNLSIFKDNSVDLIYACHCLEHFSYIKVPQVLAEWFRVLKKDGILRLSVPDFDVLLSVYEDSGNEVNSIMNFLMGGQDYKFNFHKAIFNNSSLSHLLKNAGFNQITKWSPGSSELTTFDDYSSYKIFKNDKFYQISLNLEASK